MCISLLLKVLLLGMNWSWISNFILSQIRAGCQEQCDWQLQECLWDVFIFRVSSSFNICYQTAVGLYHFSVTTGLDCFEVRTYFFIFHLQARCKFSTACLNKSFSVVKARIKRLDLMAWQEMVNHGKKPCIFSP